MEVPHLYCATPADFNKWLAKNHKDVEVLWLCYFKKHSGKESITWEESVEEALCFGWIDGLRKSIDDESYKIRFTPRRRTSIWSAKNIDTIARLIKEKRIQPAGLGAYMQRKEERSRIYSFEKDEITLSSKYMVALQKNKKAYSYFTKMAPSTRKISIGWVMTAKREETRERRFKTFVESCQHGQLVPPLNWSKK